MDGAGRSPGTVAKVPHVSSGLYCDGNRRWAVGVYDNVLPDNASNPVCDGALVPCSTTRISSPHVRKFHKLYKDDRLRVTGTVYNAVLNRPESVKTSPNEQDQAA
jgi:hypothetical protein